jgi:hypothetical protein
MTGISCPFVVPMIQLAPRGWLPNPYLTGGNIPGQTLWIPEDHWVDLGSPQTIEDYYDSLSDLEVESVVNTANFRGFPTPQEM